MSKWVRGIYNAAANFNMSRSLRAAAGRCLGRNPKHMREECDKRDKRDESSVANKSCESYECGTPDDCLGCAPYSCARFDPNSKHYRGEDVRFSVTRIQYIGRDEDGTSGPITIAITAREQDGSIEYTYSTEREDAGTWVRVGDEHRTSKQTNNATADSIEHSTGIPAGVTV